MLWDKLFEVNRFWFSLLHWVREQRILLQGGSARHRREQLLFVSRFGPGWDFELSLPLLSVGLVTVTMGERLVVIAPRAKTRENAALIVLLDVDVQ